MVKEISKVHNKVLLQTKLFNWTLNLFKTTSLFKKAFGNLVYDRQMSNYEINYTKLNFIETIKKTEL